MRDDRAGRRWGTTERVDDEGRPVRVDDEGRPMRVDDEGRPEKVEGAKGLDRISLGQGSAGHVGNLSESLPHKRA